MAATKRCYSNVVEWTAEMWLKEFFLTCKLPSETLENYSFSFADNGITWDMLPLLTDDHLKQMKIVKVGHTIEIMRRIKEIMKEVEQEGLSAPKRMLSTVSKPASSPSSSGSKMIQLSSAERRPRHLLHQTPKENFNKPRVLPPDEGSTLTVKMPSTVKACNGERSSAKERISNQSVEVSSSTEKDHISVKAPQALSSGIQKSVFNRLGSIISPVAKSSQSIERVTDDGSETISQYSDPPGRGKWFKDDNTGQRVSERLHGEKLYGPREPPQQTVTCNGLTSSQLQQSSDQRLPPPILKKTSPNRLQIPSLDNPLVTRVIHQTNQSSFPITKRNISTSKPFIGSMKADREQFYREENNKNTLIKQRLGGKSLFGPKEDDRRKEGKRVSFDLKVSQQEIPAVQGTQRIVSNTSHGAVYSGSIVLGTRRNSSL